MNLRAISFLNIIIFNCVISHSVVGPRLNSNLNALEFDNIAQPPFGYEDLEKIRTEERIASFGYPVELHEVVTADGYILTMQRIPYGKTVVAQKRKPVLLHHGGMGDSFNWVFNDPDKLLIFQLANEGYDVWLANARGTMYSRKHTSMTDQDIRYFDFSIDELAKYDIPAEIDYILKASGSEKLFYIGISLGAPLIHMTLSLFPEYNNKVCLVASLAPSIYAQNIVPFVDFAGFIVGQLPKVILDFVSGGTGEFPPPMVVKIMKISARAAVDVCKKLLIGMWICDHAAYVVYGGSVAPSKMDLMPLVLSHSVCPISTKMVFQFFQFMSTGRFQQYDFGTPTNLRVYGTPIPPLYYLNDTRVPVAVFYTLNDFVVPPQDVARVVSELPNVVLNHRIEAPFWNHVDFLTGEDTNEYFNNYLLELFRKY